MRQTLTPTLSRRREREKEPFVRGRRVHITQSSGSMQPLQAGAVSA
jgi:hypothetical protein